MPFIYTLDLRLFAAVFIDVCAVIRANIATDEVSVASVLRAIILIAGAEIAANDVIVSVGIYIIDRASVAMADVLWCRPVQK